MSGHVSNAANDATVQQSGGRATQIQRAGAQLRLSGGSARDRKRVLGSMIKLTPVGPAHTSTPVKAHGRYARRTRSGA